MAAFPQLRWLELKVHPLKVVEDVAQEAGHKAGYIDQVVEEVDQVA